MWVSGTRMLIGCLVTIIVYHELEAASMHRTQRETTERKCGYDVSF